MDIEPRKSRVAYYFDDEIGLYTFNKGHPMRPFRMKITDELVNVGWMALNAGLWPKTTNAMF
jgi:hypothetical protein